MNFWLLLITITVRSSTTGYAIYCYNTVINIINRISPPFSLLQEARHQLHLDITDKHTTLEIDGECYVLNNNSANIGFQVNPTRTVKGSVTPETLESFSNYNKLRAEAEMKASKHLREAIFATLQQTANDLEAQRQASEYSFRKRIHETNQARSELEWQQKNVCVSLGI